MSGKRQKAEARGRRAEWIARWWLQAKGYRILDHRARTAAGEIDLIASRGKVLAFIEVKARPSVDEAIGSVGPRQRGRIIRAASLWCARHVAFQGLHFRYDLFVVAPGSWPVHHRAAWLPEDNYSANLL